MLVTFCVICGMLVSVWAVRICAAVVVVVVDLFPTLSDRNIITAPLRLPASWKYLVCKPSVCKALTLLMYV